MLKIGITGCIGSGKTFISKKFAKLGVPIYSADEVGKHLLTNSLKEKVIKEFGSEIYTDGDLNKKMLAEIVFTDTTALSKLNGLVHPAVREHFKNWLTEQNTPYVLQEAAILFESGAYKLLDSVIVVHTDEELRIKRVMNRDNVTRYQVIDRMNNQMSQEEKLKMADYKIENSESAFRRVSKQIMDIHNDITNKSLSL